MARRNAAARRATAEDQRGSADPERPDNIASSGEADDVIDINSDAKDETVDVNAEARDTDARSDAVKDDERRQREESSQLRDRAVETGGEVEDPPRGEEEDDRGNRGQGGRERRAQQRLNREREARRRSDQRVTNLTTENTAIKDRLAKLERSGGEKEIANSLAQLEARLNTMKTELAAAIEAGSTEKQLDLTIKIGEVQADIALARRDLAAAKANPPAARADAGGDRGADPGAEDTGTPALVEDWTRANRRWWNLPSAKVLREAAIAIDKTIVQEIKDGDLEMDEYSEEHLDELTRRVAEEKDRLKLDNIKLKDFEGEDFVPDEEDDPDQRDERRPSNAANGRDNKGKDVRGNDRGSRRSPQGGMGGRDGRRGAQTDLELARQGKARLTEDDYAQMRVFKLDPTDKEVRKRFAKERVRTILTEANKGDRK